MQINLDHEGQAGFITPRLRVFLSVDLIGSTEFKTRHSASNNEWPSVLMAFYSDFQNKLSENWKQWKPLYDQTPNKADRGPGPRLWKALGDELIFWKECRSEHDVCSIVQIWRKTLIEFKSSWTHSELRFKTGAWLVGTPATNWEVAFLKDAPVEDDAPYLGDGTAYNFHLLSHYYDPENNRSIDIDFIGPSMDCGFRLLKIVDEEKMILSADLAYIVAISAGWWNQNFKKKSYPAIQFYLDESVPLSGVTNNTLDYPIIWLSSLSTSEETAERKHIDSVRLHLGSGPKVISTEKVQELLDRYLGEIDCFPRLPYICKKIPTGVEITSGEMPTAHVEKLSKYRTLYLNAINQDRDIIDSLEANGEGVHQSRKDIEMSVKKVSEKIPDSN